MGYEGTEILKLTRPEGILSKELYCVEQRARRIQEEDKEMREARQGRTSEEREDRRRRQERGSRGADADDDEVCRENRRVGAYLGVYQCIRQTRGSQSPLPTADKFPRVWYGEGQHIKYIPRSTPFGNQHQPFSISLCRFPVPPAVNHSWPADLIFD